MKKTIALAYIAVLIAFILPFFGGDMQGEAPQDEPVSVTAKPGASTALPPTAEAKPVVAAPAPEKIRVLLGETAVEMDMQGYLLGVVAAEMPASFQQEALKAQAVAARTYAIYCADSNKHGSAQVCTDFGCCQAWIDDASMRKNWGDSYDTYLQKLQTAIAETEGEYLSYEGQAIFAAFHSSSAGATEDCGEVWNEREYLKSVDSPETAEDVPNYNSRLDCAPLDFRDTILSAFPDADFSADESAWLGPVTLEDSGRVAEIEIGGVKIKGTKLRSLFSLRSTSLRLEYIDGRFIFNVTGFGHGVGMSQYGAKVMAEDGADYAQILAHYYPGTALIK